MDEAVEDWDQDPRGMLRVYQQQSYKLGESIADLIDNSYDANAKRIEVDIGLDPETEGMYIRILDDGDGIHEKSWKGMMTLGAQKKRPKTELGIYGVGMKLSSLSQANEVTIASVNKGRFGLRRISADYIKDTGRNKLLVTSTDSAAYKASYKKMIEGNWSTMILLENIHSERKFSSLSSKRETSINKEIKRIKVHLGLTFDRVMKSKSRGQTQLFFQEKKLEPIDPFMEWDNDPVFGSVANIKIPIDALIDGERVPVLLAPAIIPHDKLTGDRAKRIEVNRGYKLANAMQGLYIYRNDRLIQYGGWNGLYGETDEEHNKLGKIAIDVPPGYEEYFGLSPTKNQLYLPFDFLNRVKKELEKPRQWGQIKNSAKLGYREAFKYRYDNDGKAAKKKPPAGKKAGKTEQPSPKELFDPSKKTRKKEAKPKQGVVSSIKKEGKNTIVTIDNSLNESEELIRFIRRWQN